MTLPTIKTAIGNTQANRPSNKQPATWNKEQELFIIM